MTVVVAVAVVVVVAAVVMGTRLAFASAQASQSLKVNF